MRRSLRSSQECRRTIIADLSCIPADRIFDAASLTITSALLLSHGIRRDTCLYLILKPLKLTRRLLLLIEGSKIRGYRPDIGSSRGFIKRVLIQGDASGVKVEDLSESSLNEIRLSCKEGVRELVKLYNLTLGRSKQSVLSDNNNCYFFSACSSTISIWWGISVLNILLDRIKL